MKEILIKSGLVLLISIVLVVFVYRFADAPPPKEIVIAGGAVGGSFDAHAQAYAKALEKEGIGVKVINSNGGYQNLEWLSAGQVDLAFVTGGLSSDKELNLTAVRSLGAIDEEPVFIFYRKGLKVSNVHDLLGKVIDIAPEGSGTHKIAQQILDLNGITGGNSSFLSQGYDAAVQGLLQGKTDAIFLLAPADSERVISLIRNPNINVLSFDDAEAYTIRLPYLKLVKIPKGIYDLAAPLPEKTIVLPSVSVLLVSRSTLHPAIAYLLMRTGERLYYPRTLLHEPGAYPSPKWSDISLHNEAQLHFESRVPWIYNTFPYQIAVRLHRIQLWLIPILPTFILFWKILLPSLQFRIRRKICKFYEELHRLQSEMGQVNVSREKVLKDLDQLEERILGYKIPLMHRQDYHHLISHLHQIRDEFRAR